jgi:hypothetical protein
VELSTRTEPCETASLSQHFMSRLVVRYSCIHYNGSTNQRRILLFQPMSSKVSEPNSCISSIPRSEAQEISESQLGPLERFPLSVWHFCTNPSLCSLPETLNMCQKNGFPWNALIVQKARVFMQPSSGTGTAFGPLGRSRCRKIALSQPDGSLSRFI